MTGLSRSLPLAATLALLGACASSSRLGDIQPLAKELPAELQKKFEVVERGEKTTPAVSPSPSPIATKRAVDKKRRRGKHAKASIAAPPPFVIPDRRPKVNPVWIGERQVLEVTYIGIKAGEFTLDVLPVKQVADRPVYHLRANAVSSSMMNLFYSLNDTLESFWDVTGLFSHRFHLVLDETKQKRDALELYDPEAKKAFYWNRRNHVDKGNTETKETFDIQSPFVQDSFSALYYVRTLPLEDGKVYSFPVVSEGKEWEAVVTVVRREDMDTPLGKKRCVVIRPQTRFQGVIKQEKGDSFIWLTDDDRRFIVRLEAEVKVGSVSARLTSVEPGEKPDGE
ncbi:MAG: DUF3108 domain-containing protein [Bdellovibrionales bacterium]|nr:DUF3108 domain-containing protein [Bdellovibrionales bacterium]